MLNFILTFILDILISFLVLGIGFLPPDIVGNKSLKNIAYFFGFLGIMLVGTGIYIGGGETVHAYYYISLVVELLILGLFLFMRRQFKKAGHSTLIDICSISLLLLSQLMYVYWIVASFIYY